MARSRILSSPVAFSVNVTTRILLERASSVKQAQDEGLDRVSLAGAGGGLDDGMAGEVCSYPVR